MSQPEKLSNSTPFDRLKSLYFRGKELDPYENATRRSFKDGHVTVRYFNEKRSGERGQIIWCAFEKKGVPVFDFLVGTSGLLEVALPGHYLSFDNSERIEVGRVPFAYRYTGDHKVGVIPIESGRYNDPADGGKPHDEFRSWGEKIVAWAEEVVKRDEIGEIPLKLTSE